MLISKYWITILWSSLLSSLFDHVYCDTSDDFNYHFANCVIDIADKHFKSAGSVVVSYYSEYSDNVTGNLADIQDYKLSIVREDPWTIILQNLFGLNKFSVSLFRIQSKKHENGIKRVNHEGYIIISGFHSHQGILEDIIKQIMVMRRLIDWNPRAKFVVVILDIKETDVNRSKSLAEDILIELWKWKVVDCIVITKRYYQNKILSHEGILDSYTWFPFHPVGGCGDVKNAILLDQWIVDEGGERFLYNKDLFPSKVPNHLNGCPLKVSTFEFGPMVMDVKTKEDGTIYYTEGVEFLLMKELASNTNMTLSFLPPPPDNGFWGADLGNGTWNGVPGEIIRGVGDIGAAGIWYKCDLINEIECLTPHMVDTVQWYVPCAKPNPRWTSLTRVFKPSLWFGFLVVYIIVAFIMYLVVKVSDAITPEELQNEAYSGLVKCLLNFWAIILEESASNYPPHILSIRTVFLTWVLYCWAINNVYQTYLTSFLVDPGLQHQISTEKEMLEFGIGYGVFPGTAAHIKDLHSSLYPNRKRCDTVGPCLDRVANKGDFSFVFSSVLIDYQISVQYMDSDGNPTICMVDDLVSIHLIILPVMKGNPMLRSFNKIVRHVSEAGLIGEWFNLVKYQAALKLAKTFSLPPGEYIKLTLNHLQSAFYFLFLGYFFSVMSFVGEILNIRCRKDKIKQ